jgi:hypothetical protein
MAKIIVEEKAMKTIDRIIAEYRASTRRSDVERVLLSTVLSMSAGALGAAIALRYMVY